MKYLSFNLEPTEYPALFYPESIVEILEATPPEPRLNLIPLPSRPVKPVDNENLPSFDKRPPHRINYGFVAASAAIAFAFIVMGINAGVEGFILFLLITLGIAGATGAFVWYWQTYPKRLDEYREEKLKHQYALEDFQKRLMIAESNYQSLLQEYENECKQCERENQLLTEEHRLLCAELKKPEVVEEWRNSKLNSLLDSVSLSPAELDEYVNTKDFDPRGFVEHESNSKLPGLLRQYFGKKIHVLRRVNGRIPDFAYVDIIDEFNTLSIDIEIDEPYTPRQYPNNNQSLKLTHCLGQDEYDYRTQEFQSNDWFVLFFSERQALYFPHECCKTVAQIIDEITGSKLVLSKFQGVKDLIPEPRWTESQAKAMAERRERLNYRSANNSSYSSQMVRDILFEMSQFSSEKSKQSDNLTSSNSVSTIPDKKAKQLIRKKYKHFLKANRDLQPNRINAQKFLENLIHPSKTGQASHWVRVKGIQEALLFLENYKPEIEESVELL